jgi:hypothetical protein
MSDFGAVLDYAMVLAGAPAPEGMKAEDMRPAFLGPLGKRNPVPPPPPKAELEAKTQSEWLAARDAAAGGAHPVAPTAHSPATAPAAHSAADDKRK